MEDSYQQWSCVECAIKREELKNLEKRFLVYKEKLVLTDELIKKFSTKCTENDSLRQMTKKHQVVLKSYRDKLLETLKKYTPLTKEVDEVKTENTRLKEKLEHVNNKSEATEKHNVQLNNLVQDLNEKICELEMRTEVEKESKYTHLNQSLKETKAAKISSEKKRLKLLQNVISLSDFVQKEGRLAPGHKKLLVRWRADLGNLINIEGDLSEDEGIFSPEVPSSCSSRDTAELLSDDDHNSVLSVNLDKDHNDVTCKPLASDNTRKLLHKKSRKPSANSAIPLSLDCSEVSIDTGGIHISHTPDILFSPVLRSDKSTYTDETMSGPTKGKQFPSLFDPDIPLSPCRSLVDEIDSNGTSGIWNSSGSLPLLDASSEEEDLEHILKEMQIPVMLSPMSPKQKVKLRDTSTSTCVQMQDSCVGTDTSVCNAAVQTRSKTYLSSATQTVSTTCRTVCTQTNCVTMDHKARTYQDLLKGTEKVKFLAVAPRLKRQNGSVPNKPYRMVRHDYKNTENNLEVQLKKYQSLAEWLCSNNTDDEESTNEIPLVSSNTRSDRATDPTVNQLKWQKYRSEKTRSDHLPSYMQRPRRSSRNTYSTDFTKSQISKHEDPLHYPEVFSQDTGSLSPPFFQQFMNTLLLQQNMLNYQMTLQAELCKNNCPYATHTCSCHPRSYSNHQASQTEDRQVQTECSRPVRRIWHRIQCHEDESSYDSEACGDHTRPSNKTFLKSPIHDSSDTEEEEDVSTRRRIVKNVDHASGRKSKQTNGITFCVGKKTLHSKLMKSKLNHRPAGSEKDVQASSSSPGGLSTTSTVIVHKDVDVMTKDNAKPPYFVDSKTQVGTSVHDKGDSCEELSTTSTVFVDTPTDVDKDRPVIDATTTVTVQHDDLTPVILKDVDKSPTDVDKERPVIDSKPTVTVDTDVQRDVDKDSDSCRCSPTSAIVVDSKETEATKCSVPVDNKISAVDNVVTSTGGSLKCKVKVEKEFCNTKSAVNMQVENKCKVDTIEQLFGSMSDISSDNEDSNKITEGAEKKRKLKNISAESLKRVKTELLIKRETSPPPQIQNSNSVITKIGEETCMASRNTQTKPLSKLQKMKRNLIKAKLPSKIASEAPEKLPKKGKAVVKSKKRNASTKHVITQRLSQLSITPICPAASLPKLPSMYKEIEPSPSNLPAWINENIAGTKCALGVQLCPVRDNQCSSVSTPKRIRDILKHSSEKLYAPNHTTPLRAYPMELQTEGIIKKYPDIEICIPKHSGHITPRGEHPSLELQSGGFIKKYPGIELCAPKHSNHVRSLRECPSLEIQSEGVIKKYPDIELCIPKHSNHITPHGEWPTLELQTGGIIKKYPDIELCIPKHPSEGVHITPLGERPSLELHVPNRVTPIRDIEKHSNNMELLIRAVRDIEKCSSMELCAENCSNSEPLTVNQATPISYIENCSNSEPPTVNQATPNRNIENCSNSEPPTVYQATPISYIENCSNSEPPTVNQATPISYIENCSNSEPPTVNQATPISYIENCSNSEPPTVNQATPISYIENCFNSEPPTVNQATAKNFSNNEPPTVNQATPVRYLENCSNSEPFAVHQATAVRYIENCSSSEAPTVNQATPVRYIENCSNSEPPSVNQVTAIRYIQNCSNSEPPTVNQATPVRYIGNCSNSEPPIVNQVTPVRYIGNCSNSEPPIVNQVTPVRYIGNCSNSEPPIVNQVTPVRYIGNCSNSEPPVVNQATPVRYIGNCSNSEPPTVNQATAVRYIENCSSSVGDNMELTTPVKDVDSTSNETTPAQDIEKCFHKASVSSPDDDVCTSPWRITRSSAQAHRLREFNMYPGCALQAVLVEYKKTYKRRKAAVVSTHRLRNKELIMSAEMKKQEKVIFKEELNKFLSAEFDFGKFVEVLQKFGEMDSDSAPKVLAKYVIQHVLRDAKGKLEYCNQKCVPTMTQTQQRLVTLVNLLEKRHESYSDLSHSILLGIEYLLFRLGHAPNVNHLCSLGRFYAALCRIRQDVGRVQAFCYDAMYCLYFKSFPLMFTVFTTYPEVLPHADIGKGVLLVVTMTSIILSQSTTMNQSAQEYRIDALKMLLQTHYGYKQEGLTCDQLLLLLMGQMKKSGGYVEGLEPSLVLISKRIGWEMSYKVLLSRNLIPLVEEWKRGGAVSNDIVRQAILVMGNVARCFPVVQAKANVQTVINFLSSLLLEEKNVPMDIQEAVVTSLIRLSRHNFFATTQILAKWESSSHVSDVLLQELLVFFECRKPKWWDSFIKNKTLNKKKKVKHL